MDLVAVALGLGVGLILGVIGVGGVMMTIPLLMIGVDFNIAQASTGSLLVVAAASLVGAIARGFQNVCVRCAIVLAIAGAPGATLGSLIAVQLAEKILESILIVIMFYAAYSIWNRPTSDSDLPELQVSNSTLITIGLGVGFVTGLIGISGGIVLIPAMVLKMRLSLSIATATGLLIMLTNSLIALGWRLIADDSMSSQDWETVFIVSLIASVGSFVGAKVANKINKQMLQRVFATFLCLLALTLILELLGVWTL